MSVILSARASRFPASKIELFSIAYRSDCVVDFLKLI